MTTTAVSQQAQSQAQYDVRAPPRRRAKGDEADEQPVFLRKAYNMISSCPPEIGKLSTNLHCVPTNEYLFLIPIRRLVRRG